MKFLIVYLIGVAISLVSIFAIEFFYYYDLKIRYITLSEILEDIGISLLSWIGVLTVIFWVVTEWHDDFKYRGEDYRLRKLEEEMREEYERRNAKTGSKD